MAAKPPSDAATVAAAGPMPTGLKEVITTRQFIFMALSSSIGAGLLLSTGQTLAVGGPAPLLIAFAVVGFAVWITMCNLGELSTNFPVRGSFYEYSVRFISPAWGFAMGWNYVVNMVFIIPFEIIVTVMCARFWNPDISAFYLIPAFILGLAVIYFFGATWYAEAENVFGILKITVIAVFVVTAFCILTGSVPADTDVSAYESWHTEPFKNGAPGFLFAFTAAGMAYGGTEMLGLTAAECRSPQRVMKLASRLVAGRIILLYLLPVIMLGLVLKVDLGSASASNGNSTTGELTSPFVLAVSQANIHALPDLMNAVIIVAIFSMANAATFASSRALQAICARGMGPAFCARLYRDKPLGALVVVFMFSLLSFAKTTCRGDEVFVWLLSLASCSNYLTWSSICVAQVRFRLALKRQGKSLDNPEVYRSPVGMAGSVLAIFIFAFGLAAQIAAAAKSPLPSPPPVASSFVGLLFVAVFWAGYVIYRRHDTLIVRLNAINLESEEPEFIPVDAVETERVAV